jgi:hypothetical protein
LQDEPCRVLGGQRPGTPENFRQHALCADMLHHQDPPPGSPDVSFRLALTPPDNTPIAVTA